MERTANKITDSGNLETMFARPCGVRFTQPSLKRISMRASVEEDCLQVDKQRGAGCDTFHLGPEQRRA